MCMVLVGTSREAVSEVVLVDPRGEPVAPVLGSVRSRRHRLYVAIVERGGRATLRDLAFALGLMPREVAQLAASLPGVLPTGNVRTRAYVIER